MKTDSLFQSEHQIHVVDSLSAGSFQQVIDHRSDEQLILDLLQIDQTLVGVDHLLEVGSTIRDKGKRMIGIILLVLIILGIVIWLIAK